VKSIAIAGHVLRMGLGSLWAYRLRSGLTALGVTMGVATVIGIVSIIEGLDASFDQAVASMGTGTIYVTQRPWIVLGDWWRYKNRPSITRAETEWVDEHVSLAKVVVPFVHERASIEVGGSSLIRVRVIGTTADWPVMAGIEPIAGRFLSSGEVAAGQAIVVAGADVVQALEHAGLGVGDRIRVAGHPLRVIGLLPGRGRIFSQSQDDYVVIPLPLFERIFGKRRSLNIGVVTEPALLPQAEAEVIGALRAKRKLGPAEETNFSVNQQQMLVDVYKKLTRSLYATAIGLGLITLLVAGIGIMNIMLVAVAERTKEIGVRKALGARPGSILLQFLVEGALVSGAGGVLGTTLGVLIAKGLAAATPLPAAAPLGAIALGVVFGIMVGVGFGIVPAYRASRLEPVEALAQGG
jgi:putative ABC transport system permease protein